MKISIVIAIFLVSFMSNAQTDSIDYDYKPIQWMTWDQAMAAKAIKPKKILIFIKDEMSPNSKKMEVLEFQDTVVNIYLNNYYYAVMMDCQSKDTIRYKNREFYYKKDHDAPRGYHTLSQSLTDHKSLYPALVVFNEEFQRLQVITGFFNGEQMSLMLARFAHDEHLKEKQVITFGQNFQCQDPNHPHNRLRNRYQRMESPAIKKEE